MPQRGRVPVVSRCATRRTAWTDRAPVGGLFRRCFPALACVRPVGRSLSTGTQDAARTPVRGHAKFSLMDLCAGILIATLLAWSGIAGAASGPWMVIVSLAPLGPIVRLLCAGRITGRPGQVRINSRTPNAACSAQWMVIAHTADRAEGERATSMVQFFCCWSRRGSALWRRPTPSSGSDWALPVCSRALASGHCTAPCR